MPNLDDNKNKNFFNHVAQRMRCMIVRENRLGEPVMHKMAVFVVFFCVLAKIGVF